MEQCMNLNNFKRCIEPVILERGYDYYENGAVVSLKETEDNVYEARVEGTELYTVNVELGEQGDITYTVCDCPYDRGEYCKHQVAALLALQDLKESHPKGRRAEKTQDLFVEPQMRCSKKRTDIKQLLEGRTKEDLILLLVRIASEYEEIRRRIELSFGSGDEQDELKKSVALIRSYVNKYTEYDGFIDYRDMEHAVKGAEMVLDNAWCIADAERPVYAVALALCVIRETISMLDSSDDGEGTAQEIIYSGIELIGKVAGREDLTETDKESIFDRLIKEAKDPAYKEWKDFILEFLRACAKLSVDKPEQRIRLDEAITSMIGEESGTLWSSNYYDQRLNMIRYQMVAQCEGEKDASAFIKEHLQYSEFRKMAIEAAFKEKNYDEVDSLARAGEEQDQDKLGLVKLWREYRCQVYRLTDNTDGLRKLALDFILDGGFEYYQELKSTYEPLEWADVYPGVIRMLENKKRTELPVYADILIEEDEKQKLLEYVKENVSRVTRFYKYLVPEYQDIVYKMFRQYIEYSAERANSRSGYKGVCAIIRGLKKAGGREKAAEAKQALLKKYPRRSALRDELTKI